MLSSHLILCHPLFLVSSIFPRIRVFSNESTVCIRWPRYWSFSINPSNEYSGLISFKIDWFDLHAVQGTPKSLLQHHSLKTSIGRHSLFFTIQLSHPYMTTGKTIALTRRTFVGKIMQFSSIQSLSLVWLFVTPWTVARQAFLSVANSWSLPEFMSIASVMLLNHLTPVSLFSFCLQSFPPSGSFPVSHLFASGAILQY